MPASAEDDEKLLGTVNDAARAVNARFVTLLTVGGYIAVIVASTTDEMLVRGSPVTLPLLNVSIPISGAFGFYMVAPWLILTLHWDLLVQLSILGRKLVRFHEALTHSSELFRARIATDHYVQFLSGEPSGWFRRALQGTTLFVLMIAPPLALLGLMQLRSLPVRDSLLSYSQGLALIVDVFVILVLLWPLVMWREARVWGERPAYGRLGSVLSLRTIMVLACFSVPVFSVRACYEAERGAPSAWYYLDLRHTVLTGKDLTPEAINDLTNGDVEKREKQLTGVLQLNVLQGHDLRGANFVYAVAPRLDLRSLKLADGTWEYTQLSDADLSWTEMQAVQLADTDLRRAKLRGAQLQGASMARVKLQDADLDGAQLQEADLKNAQLDRAELPTAQLQGADLENASLLGAVLTQANLRGANLRGARLKLADLSEADIEGADLSGANLSGARLRGAKLRGTLLCGATIHKADFDGTNLDQANLCAAADHPLAEEMGFIPRVCFGQCCLREVDPSGRQCKYEVHPSASPEYLVTLACRDAYTARGLSKQALRAERSGLASDLLTKASDADCPGVRLLPIRTLAELRRHPANAESR